MAPRSNPSQRPYRSAPADKTEKLLGEALASFTRGNIPGADLLVKKVLARAPQNHQARHLAAMVAFSLGKAEAAADQLQALLAETPDDAFTLNDYGLVLTKLNRFPEAEAALVKAINLKQGMAGFHLNLANVYKQQSVLEDAEAHARAAVFHKRDYADAYRLLSEILVEDGRAEEAIRMAETARRLAPHNPLGYIRYAEALIAADRISEAHAVFEQASARFPDNLNLQTLYGNFLNERGFFEDAATLMRNLMKTYPDWPGLHTVLARSIKYDHYDEQMAHMEKLLERQEIEAKSEANLHFGLAKAYEDIKDYPKSLEHSLKGNALARKWKRYSKAASDANFNATRSAFTPEVISRFADAGFMDETPIFVLGMPRSGTTLTEQILSSHHDVHGAGELFILSVLIRALRGRLDAKNNIDLVARATPEDWRALGEDYITQLRRRAPDARYIVDKMPGNFLHVGAIRLALPKAKVIYCKRSAPDNCISIFNIQFATTEIGYGYDLTDLGAYYRKHVELMQHWQTLLPGFLLTNQYEDMVADQEAQMHRLLDFCGLDWDDNVLSFFNSNRSVRTASTIQVRQPIYNSSIGRYKRYGDAVQPLLDALDWDEEKGEIRP